MKRQGRLSLFLKREADFLNQELKKIKGFSGLYFGARQQHLHVEGLKHFFTGTSAIKTRGDAVWDIHAWPIPTDFLDVVILDHPLDLASDFKLVMQEILRVLRKDGTLIITGFNRTRLCSWPVQSEFGKTHACTIQRYSSMKLLSLLNEQGFITEINYFDFCRFTILDKIFSKVIPFLGIGFVITAKRKTIDLGSLEEMEWQFNPKKLLQAEPLQGEYQKYDK